MKILKVEVKNINSLKSDFPIVIDLEDDKFRDVGLFAITGSTGAGKTTILDAISIALYHHVPRFNGTKGTLVDVVSHGAIDASCRVTFENNNTRYEVYWSIRVADKSGKKYKTPKEEVRLNNLSSGEILAEQKRTLIAEVIKVTQLDYNQFLRSVMLAQGEFASFLSAKGPDKGRLLEQITGEQIYKKIGQGILERKSAEDSKLREIQSRINLDDVLTEDEKTVLFQKDKELDDEIIITDKALKSVRLVVDWYVNFRMLVQESTNLDQEDKELTLFCEAHKGELALLDLNIKAEPFKDIIQLFDRTERKGGGKSKQIELLEKELAELRPAIKRSERLHKEQSLALEAAEKEFSEWLPKFDMVTKLDSELKNEAEKQQKAKQKSDELTLEVALLKRDKSDLSKDLVRVESIIKNDEVFVSQNKFLKKIESEISDWTRELTTLKANNATLNNDATFVANKLKEVEHTTTTLNIKYDLLDQETLENQKVEKALSSVTDQLEKHVLSDLLTEKETLSLAIASWSEFKNISEQSFRAQKEQKAFIDRKSSLLIELQANQKEIEVLADKIKIQEQLVAKADKILKLEQIISKYEDDRQQLIKGEPCALCGSETHPYVDYLAPYNVSKAEMEFQHTKTVLKSLSESKVEWDKKEIKLKTTIDNLTLQSFSLTEVLKSLESSAQKLNVDCELDNVTKMTIEADFLNEKMALLDKRIKLAHKLQREKNELEEHFKSQSQSLVALKTAVAALNEKIKNTDIEIEIKQKTIGQLRAVYDVSVSDLKVKLARFNYSLPSVKRADLFIQEIEKEIVFFNEKEKNLESLKASVVVMNNNISHIEQLLESHYKLQDEHLRVIDRGVSNTAVINAQRTEILAINITVESKRNGLQSSKKKLAEGLTSSSDKLQKLSDLWTQKSTLVINCNIEHKELVAELAEFRLQLDAMLLGSDFESKQDVEKAFLSDKDKLNYTKKKDKIKEQELRLKTLKGVNVKAREELEKSRISDTSEAESQLTLQSLEVQKQNVSAEKGKISEAFRKDQEIRDRNQEVCKRIVAQEEICGVWQDLFKIIGGSKDAFNTYVQRLTLKHLLELANYHLTKLNKRYSLKLEEQYKPKEELNFNLIDHYQTDQTRLVDTSSGGEKFIISLALALGLSDLASKSVKIGSLFIDEGFGTLDNNTLETVISTLETLQSQGKMIGVISHVETLKERIPTQIRITKKSNGVSVVDIP